jgi:hypothetical protein
MRKIVFLLTVLLGLTAAAADFQIPFRAEAAKIDGKDDDACWQDLEWNSGFVRNLTGKKAEAETRFKIFHNNKAFYILTEAMEPEMDKLVLKSYTPDGGHHWRNDSLEINFVPDPKVMSFYKFMVDAAGVMDDLQCVDDNTDREVYAYNRNWDGHAEAKTERLADRWRLEMMIPVGAMDIDAATTAKWRFNLARNRYAGVRESTSWSKISKQNNNIPRQFRQVELENFKAKNFQIEAVPPAFRFVRKLDGSFEFSTKFDLVNRTGSFKLVTIRYNLLDPETRKVLYSFHTRKELLRDFLAKTADTFKGSAPGNYIFSTEILSSGTKPYLLKMLSRPVKLEYQPLKIRMVRPAYRNNIYATMPDKTIEAEIDPGEFAGISLKAELIGPNGFKESKTIAKSTAKNKVVFDGAKLVDGRYTLRVSGQQGKEKLVSEVKLRKLPYRKGEVWLDARGVTYVDGKLFLPYGFSGGTGKYGWSFTNWSETPIRYCSVEAAKKGIDGLFKKSGLRSAVLPFTDLDGKSSWVNTKFTHDKLKGGLTPEQRQRIIDFVPEVSKCEGLLIWQFSDEPEGKDHNPRWYEEAYELIRELDPYHPTTLTNYGIHGMQTYYTGVDLLVPDCYPYFWADGSCEKPRTCTAEWVKAGSALRPTWIEPIATLWPGWSQDGKRGIPPDYHDQRQQVYQAVIHNAKGFIFYNYPRGQFYSSCIIGPRATGQNIRKIQEYVLENSIPNGVSVKTSPACPDFQAGMKVYKGQFCVIANNTSLKGVKSEFTLRNKFTGKLYPEGAGRSVTVRNGRFSDTFRGKETILYFTDEKLAASLIPVDTTLKEIEDHLAARNNPKNLLSRGELIIIYKANQKRLSDPDIPKITSSSDTKYYITHEIGTSLYFLIDGLTDTDQMTYTWTPQPSDKKPWVEFKLPKKHPLKELVIYTVNGNLIDCDAVVNGKTYSMRDNKSNRIAIQLGGETADTVRINILRRKPRTSGIDGCLLTEVELY